MRTILLTIVEITLGMTPLLAGALLLSRYGRRFSAGCRYAVWCLLLLRLAIPFNFTLPGAPVVLTPPAPTEIQRTVPTQTDTTDNAPTTLPVNLPDVAPTMPNSTEESPAVQPPILPESDANASLPASPPLRVTLDPVELAGWIWLCGAAGVLGWQLLGSLSAARRLRRWKRPLSTKEAAFAAEPLEKARGAVGLRQSVKVWVCPAANSPMLSGLLFPSVYLPRVDYSAEQLDAILRHELLHLRRGDLWRKAIAMLALSLHFFNPLVWAARRQMEFEMEQSCDDAVFRLGGISRQAYGQTMLTVAREGAGKPLYGLNTQFRANGAALRRRFANILDTTARRTGALFVALALTAAALCGGFVSCARERAETSDDLREQLIKLAEEAHTLELAARGYGYIELEYSADRHENARSVLSEKLGEVFSAEQVKAMLTRIDEAGYTPEFSENDGRPCVALSGQIVPEGFPVSWNYQTAYLRQLNHESATLSLLCSPVHSSKLYDGWADIRFVYEADGWRLDAGLDGQLNYRDLADEAAERQQTENIAAEKLSAQLDGMTDEALRQGLSMRAAQYTLLCAEAEACETSLASASIEAERILAQLSELAAQQEIEYNRLDLLRDDKEAAAIENSILAMLAELEEMRSMLEAKQQNIAERDRALRTQLNEILMRQREILPEEMQNLRYPLDVQTQRVKGEHDGYSLPFLPAAKQEPGLELSSGEDMQAPVFAVASGHVLEAGYDIVRGWYVLIDHGAGAYSLTSQLGSLKIAAGDTVTAGGRLGTCGRSGYARADGLRLTLFLGSNALDPTRLLQTDSSVSTNEETLSPVAPNISIDPAEGTAGYSPSQSLFSMTALWTENSGAELLTPFGANKSADYSLPAGTSIFSPCAATVTGTGENDTLGRYVALTCRGGEIILCGGMETVAVTVGQAIGQSALLGQAGGGTPFRLGLQIGDEYVDPVQYMYGGALKPVYTYTHILAPGMPPLCSYTRLEESLFTADALSQLENEYAAIDYVLRELYGNDHHYGQYTLTGRSAMLANGKVFDRVWLIQESSYRTRAAVMTAGGGELYLSDEIDGYRLMRGDTFELRQIDMEGKTVTAGEQSFSAQTADILGAPFAGVWFAPNAEYEVKLTGQATVKLDDTPAALVQPTPTDTVNVLYLHPLADNLPLLEAERILTPIPDSTVRQLEQAYAALSSLFTALGGDDFSVWRMTLATEQIEINGILLDEFWRLDCTDGVMRYAARSADGQRTYFCLKGQFHSGWQQVSTSSGDVALGPELSIIEAGMNTPLFPVEAAFLLDPAWDSLLSRSTTERRALAASAHDGITDFYLCAVPEPAQGSSTDRTAAVRDYVRQSVGNNSSSVRLPCFPLDAGIQRAILSDFACTAGRLYAHLLNSVDEEKTRLTVDYNYSVVHNLVAVAVTYTITPPDGEVQHAAYGYYYDAGAREVLSLPDYFERLGFPYADIDPRSIYLAHPNGSCIIYSAAHAYSMSHVDKLA